MTPTQIKKMLEEISPSFGMPNTIIRPQDFEFIRKSPEIISQLLKENEEMRECLEDILNADPSCELAQNLLTKLKGGE